MKYQNMRGGRVKLHNIHVSCTFMNVTKHQHLEKFITEAKNNDSDKTYMYCRSEKAEILKITEVLWRTIYQDMQPLQHHKEGQPFSQHTIQDIIIHCLIASSCLLSNNLNSEGKSSWLEYS